MEMQAPITVFGTTITHFNQLTEGALDAYENKFGRTLSSLGCSDRRRVARELHAIGFFGLKGAIKAYSERAMVTKVTTYKDIHTSCHNQYNE